MGVELVFALSLTMVVIAALAWWWPRSWASSVGVLGVAAAVAVVAELLVAPFAVGLWSIVGVGLAMRAWLSAAGESDDSNRLAVRRRPMYSAAAVALAGLFVALTWACLGALARQFVTPGAEGVTTVPFGDEAAFARAVLERHRLAVVVVGLGAFATLAVMAPRRAARHESER